MTIGVGDLYERVRARVGFSKWKHRAEDVTNDQIEAAIDEEIDAMTNLELLRAISLELEEMLDAG